MAYHRVRWRSALAGLIWLSVAPSAVAQSSDLVGHGGPVKSIQVSKESSHALSGSFDYSMIYWALTDGKPEIVYRIDTHDGAVNSAVFLPGGEKAISASDDGTLGVWDLQTGELIKRFEGHSHKVVKVTVNQAGTMAVSAAWDRTARLWDLKNLAAGPVLKGHANTLNDAVFTDNGRFVFTASSDGTIRQWHTSDGRLERLVYKHGWGVNALAMVPGDKEMLLGTQDGFVGVLDIEEGEISTILKPHERPVLAIEIDRDAGVAASGGGDGRISVWQLSTWREKYVHENPYGPVWGLSFARGGKDIYYAGLDDAVHVWQMEPQKPFEIAKGELPRRFQLKEGMGLGALQFARKCSVCHTLTPDGANRAGPTLYKLFGRKVGTVKGYKYSQALSGADYVWDEETIGSLFSEGPENFAPGTKMPLQKMSKAGERNALIAFLKLASETGEPAEKAYARFGHVERLEDVQ
ncbi:MAG: c-type cytochrome [Hyphomicrobiales bacterium]